MQQDNLINIDLGALTAGQHVFQYTLDNAFFEALDQKEILSGEVVADVQIMAREQSFQLTIQMDGHVEVTCDRCLDPVSEDVDVQEQILVKLASRDGEDDECIYLQATDPVLSLGWLLYELISVSLPIVCRHQPGECNPEMEKLLQAHLCTTIEPDDQE